MKFAKRIIGQYKNLSANIRQAGDLYYAQADIPPDIFAEKAHEWLDKSISTEDPVDWAILAGLKFMPAMQGWGNSANALRNTVISRAYAESGYFVFAANQRKNIAIFDQDNDPSKLARILDRLNKVFLAEFSTNLTLQKAPPSFLDELDFRIAETEDYYLAKHGEWTSNFIAGLGDEISQISFRTFLRQRIEAHIKWHAPAMYPINPPAETKDWRIARRNAKMGLPILEHCPKRARDFFHLHSFIYEQYGIAGIVEAKPGDTVIDAGAYIGDTALYFSQKVGRAGHVYAFEAMKENVDAANDNIRLNKVDNITMVQFALSDKNGELKFTFNEFAPSGSIQNESGNTSVQCTTIDNFAKQNGICVNFIKSDIEGGEMALLEGAKETIMRDKPVCGIALYHKQGDYHHIPQYLQSLNPDYKFYFRCEAEPVIICK